MARIKSKSNTLVQLNYVCPKCNAESTYYMDFSTTEKPKCRRCKVRLVLKEGSNDQHTGKEQSDRSDTNQDTEINRNDTEEVREAAQEISS